MTKSLGQFLTEHHCWGAFAISGLIHAPVIPLGLGPDMYLAPADNFGEGGTFRSALLESFGSFGYSGTDVTFSHPKVLLIPLSESSELAIKNALITCDLALACFNKKYAFAKARFVNWDRRLGTAVGVIRSNGTWTAVHKPARMAGPAIVRPLEPNVWDWFLSRYLRQSLPELGERLLKCIEWSREAEFSPHITHRFAYLCFALESMMLGGETARADIIRRYSLIAFAPRGSDSKRVRDNPRWKAFSDQHPSSNGKKWVKAIEELHEYRCAIVHDGSTDATSTKVDPKKIEWLYQVAKHLIQRVEAIAVEALVDGIQTIDAFWSDYTFEYLYTEKNRWQKDGSAFFADHVITFDWQNSSYPELI